MLKLLNKIFGRSHHSSEPVNARVANAICDTSHANVGWQECEKHFAHLVAGVRDYAVFLLDRQGNIATWNEGAERIKGYRPEEIIGRHFSQFYPRDAVAANWPAHELQVASETGRFEEEGWRIRKDGSRFWANVVITALRDDEGEVRGFLKITRDLTDRKQAEEKLRQSEERFRLLVEGVKDYAIFSLDPEGRITSWNAGAQRIKGYTADEIIGQHFSKFYPQEAIDRGWPAEELRIAAAQGRVEDEGWRVRKDGSLFWASVVITALRDDTGVLRGYAKVTRDLTERRASEQNARRLLQEEAARKAAEQATRQIQIQREQLRVTLASIGDGVIVTDERGTIKFLNPIAERLTGWPAQDAVGQPLGKVFRIINEATREEFENPIQTVLRENRIVALANHTAMITRDGREVPIEDSAAPIRSNGNAVSGAVLVFHDVTESRRSAEAHFRLAAIVESSDDAIIGQDLNGNISTWNRGAEKLYGYTAAEVIGRPLALLVPPDHPDEQPAMLERIKQGEYIDHFETVRMRKDGSRVDVSLTISPIKDSGGTIIGASKIARDITARKEEDRRKNEFLALLAHELRNPLAPLGNGLQVIRLAGDDRHAVEEARSIMERQLHHLVRLVDDLLDVSRVSRGKLVLRKERITLREIVANALEVCGSMVEQNGDELTVSLPEEPIYVDADKTRLAQTLCNLLGNAVKYSDEHSRIWLTVEREGDKAVIRVKDNGIGIPPDMLPRVFDLFTQVDRSLERSEGGLGVGLTIVKRLVEMHGGTVEAFSEGRGLGSEFVVRLPVALPADVDHVPEPTEPVVTGARRRILVVDDNVDAASSLAMMLKIMGNEVRTAHDGQQGLDVAKAFCPDILFLDIGMPRLNGYETAARIRQQPWGRNVVLVALTGWGQEDDRRKSQESGFDSHLVKPIDIGALKELLAGFDAAPA